MLRVVLDNLSVFFNRNCYQCHRQLIRESLYNICRDLNPLHDIMDQEDYKEKYYKDLITLGLKYSKVIIIF